jgi:hypothetical protein
MKLELKGKSIMLVATLLLLAGCKQKSGIEILDAQMSGLKALRSQYVVRKEGEKDILINVLYSKPNRILVTSDDFVVALNEVDGHFESMFSEKIYDLLPWDGKVYPGTGKIVSTLLLEAGPAVANPPVHLIPEQPWALENKKGNIERYTKTVQGGDGPQVFKLEITDKGVPVQFIVPSGISYIVKSFELVDDIPLEKFRVEPKEGFVSHRISPDLLTLETGMKFDWSKFKAANDVSQFKLDGNTMFVFVDPSEASSLSAMTWLRAPGAGYRKVTISKGSAVSGFFDPNGIEIAKVTTTTPKFVMVDKDAKVIGMWLGFDPESVAEFEKDVLSVLNKKS